MLTIKRSISSSNVLFLAVTIFFCFFQHTQASEPSSKKGIIDLSNWDFSKDGILELNGEWEFYPFKYYTPNQLLSGKISNPIYVSVPGNWKEYSIGKSKMPVFGYATYRVKLVLNDTCLSQKQSFALKLLDIFSAYKLWIDTTLVFQQGVPGKNLAEHSPKISSSIITFLPARDTITITLQAANYFAPQKSGILSPVEIGLFDQENARSRMKGLWYVGGAVFSFTLGIYFFFLFVIKQERKLNLLFALVCLVYGIRYLFDTEYLVLMFFPHMSASLMFKLLALCMNFFPLTLWIMHIFFPHEINKIIVQAVFVLFMLYSAIVIFVPIPSFGNLIKIIMVFSSVAIVYMLIMSGVAYRRKRESSGIMFLGMLFAAITFLNNTFGGKYYLPIGAILYLSLQAFAITLKFSRSHNRVVQLSEELQLLNKNLEVQVAERTKDLNFANESLKKLNSAKDRFISILSHDLRNPLNNLIGLSHRLIINANAKNTENIIGYSKMINESAVKCHTLTENLLNWSLLQSGTKKAFPEKIIMNKTIDDVFDLLKNQSTLKKIELVNNVSPECEIYADSRMTVSILLNLITNGIKFTPNNGKIEVSATRSDSCWHVSVSDTGIGMEQDEINNLFRIDKKIYNLGTEDEPGSGYGLLLTKEFVENNNGTIIVASEKNKGTVFTFSLPVYKSIAHEQIKD